jgi:lipopolysaccharide transport system permease protein
MNDIQKIKHKPLPIAIYTPESQLKKPLKMAADMLIDLKNSFGLAWRLAIRDVSSQYRQTILGLTWAFIGPIVTTLTWVFLNNSKIITISKTDIPYPIYVFTGTMLWQIFTEALKQPSTMVNNSKPMLSKINFPKEAIILSGIIQIIFSAIIKLVVLTPVLIYFGYFAKWGILLIFIGVFSLILAGTAMGMLLVPFGALFHDLDQGLGFVTQIWMFITPVVFPIPKNGWTILLFNLNPITPLIQTSREWIAGFPPTLLQNFFIVNVVMFSILFISWILYRITMPILIERMSA